MSSSNRSPEYVSDLLIDVLQKLGIEFVALNPGATFRALHDSLVQYSNNDPKLVLCCHEEIAVAIADGYARAKGKPMAVMVHDIVGLQHATKAIFETWLERLPMIIIGGTGPLGVENRRPGIDWIHTARMNANLLRDYVKWDDEPSDVTGAVESLLRGFKISTTQPMGPVYLCYDIVLQEKRLNEQLTVPKVENFMPPAPPQIEEETLEKISRHLVEARLPVIVADRLGRNPAAFAQLVQLAEILSVPVIDLGSCLSFPNTNELDVTGARDEVLRDADVILAVDVQDLEDALTSRISSQERSAKRLVSETAKTIQIGMDDYLTRGWSTDFRRLWPVDISATASSSVALPQLVSKCKKILESGKKRAFGERREYAGKIHKVLAERWAEDLKKSWNAKPISTARLAHEIWNVIKSEDWVVGHGSLNGWIRRLWPLEDPSRYLDPTSSTGSGLGVSIGVALAKGSTSGKLFLSVVGDGDMLYTPSSLWTAANMKVPLLVVMYNNRSYYQDYGHQMVMAKWRNRDTSKVGVGISIVDPTPDFAGLARSFGLNGIGPIEDPNYVEDAIKEGLTVLKREKKLTLVDVVTQPR
ncbi:MAG: thiamine pyrophosphate-binding protein [Nitrososphaerota archaeon]|nr:thiamine pyrophosphate-binding protein [Nitrososphaerota archaeon]MDG6924275.1 thiamine pyrophosphate-binding protein [Nitrososphaerota archaeon]